MPSGRAAYLPGPLRRHSLPGAHCRETCRTAPSSPRKGRKIHAPGLPKPDVITRTLSQRISTVYRILSLSACLLLTACASSPQSLYQTSVKAGHSPMASSTLEAIHNTQAIPLPISSELLAPQWPISADEPRLDFGSSISNYRVFSLELKKGERYTLNVQSLCRKPCVSFNKLALKPKAMLLDSYGAIIASKPSRASAQVGQVNLSWDGEAPEDGTYYLLVAADNDNLGETIVIDDVWVNNSPLMAVKVGMTSSPFGKISAFSSPRQN